MSQVEDDLKTQVKKLKRWIYREALPALKVCANLSYQFQMNGKKVQKVKSDEGRRAEKAIRTFYYGEEK